MGLSMTEKSNVLLSLPVTGQKGTKGKSEKFQLEHSVFHLVVKSLSCAFSSLRRMASSLNLNAF